MPREFAAAHTISPSAMAGSCLLVCWATFGWARDRLIGFVVWTAAAALAVLFDVNAILVMPFTASRLFDRAEAKRSQGIWTLTLGLVLSTTIALLVLYFLMAEVGGVEELVPRFRFDVSSLGTELLACPEWHLVFAAIGFWSAFRHYKQDPERLGIVILTVAVAIGLAGPARLVFIAPLAAVGAGRTLYRGTLTKPFRIPPAGWAIVLLTIAAVRSAVIMTTWAPAWDEYRNRVGLFVEARKPQFAK
jgi:hypothetical protein